LHYHTRKPGLVRYFEQFGIIRTAQVLYAKDTGKSRGFGFITFESPDSVDKVLNQHMHTIDGKLAEVKRATPKTESSSPEFGLMNGGIAMSGGKKYRSKRKNDGRKGKLKYGNRVHQNYPMNDNIMGMNYSQFPELGMGSSHVVPGIVPSSMMSPMAPISGGVAPTAVPPVVDPSTGTVAPPVLTGPPAMIMSMDPSQGPVFVPVAPVVMSTPMGPAFVTVPVGPVIPVSQSNASPMGSWGQSNAPLIAGTTAPKDMANNTSIMGDFNGEGFGQLLNNNQNRQKYQPVGMASDTDEKDVVYRGNETGEKDKKSEEYSESSNSSCATSDNLKDGNEK
jgi:hypothetical protein